MKTEKLHFKISSGLKDIIGKDLITNEIVAIFELVKNSYDAGADFVEIVINAEENEIIIQDNGSGMSYEDLKNKWLFVAYSDKAISSDRIYAGSKGIGRFSCDRLGANLELITKKDVKFNKLFIDWGNFEKDATTEFKSLNVLYEEVEECAYLKSNHSGTVLKISKLHDIWNEVRVKKIIKSLERLINPFDNDKNFNIKVKFIDYGLSIPIIDEFVNNPILKVLDSKTIYLHAIINKKEIDIKLVDKLDTIYHIKIKNTTLLEQAEFKIYYLSSVAKYNFTKIMKVEPKNYGSIFLYKNNFRVFPYGETFFDSFGLNMRKTQGYNRYLGHRELLGWINITDSSNHFKEVTSRDRGFVENKYAIELEKIYMELIHRPLESYIQLIKFGDLEVSEAINTNIDAIDKLINRFKKYTIIEIETFKLPEIAQPFEERIKFLSDPTISNDRKKSLENSVKKVVNETRKSLEYEIKKNKQQDKENHKLKEEIQIKNRIIRDINPERQKTLSHELGKVSKDIQGSLNRMNRRLNNDDKMRFLDFFVDLRRASDRLISIKKTILKVNLDSQNEKEKIEIKSFVSSYFENAINDERIKYNIKFDEINLVREINIFDFGVVLDNLVLNALELNAERIDIFSEDNMSLSIVTDTGPIEIEPIERIFDLGFSTKDGGTGMGMFVVKQIIEDFNWSISVKNLNNNLVEFKITMEGESVK